MRVLTFATQKGGSGKTSLAASLAVAAMQDGERVVAIDIDQQGTLTGWGKRRDARDGVAADIVFRTAQPAALHGLITGIRENNAASLVIVDTPGVFGAAVNQALQDADVVLVPTKPSIFDTDASRPLAEQLRALGKRFWFILSQVSSTSQGRAIDAAKALARLGPISPAMIGTRTDFLDASIAGLGPTELAPKGRAAEEVTALWVWAKARLEEAANG